MKSFLSGLIASIALAISPTPAFAAVTSLLNCNDEANKNLATCKAGALSISGTLATVIQFLFVIAVILALGFLIYGGIKWITSGGDKGGVEAARNMIIASIIGLIIVFLAYVIINLVLTFLTGKGLSSVEIPTLSNCVKTTEDDGTISCSPREGAPDNVVCNPDQTTKSCIQS